MAKVSVNEVVRTGRCPLPWDAYICRIIDARFAPSKKGKPMTTLSCEVVSKRDKTTEVTVDGNKYDIAGQKFQMYLLYTTDGNDPETGEFKRGQIQNVVKFNDKLKIDMPEIDTDNPEIECYKGKGFLAMMQGNAEPYRGADGLPVLDGDGKQVLGPVQIQVQFDNIIGTVDLNA